MRLCLGFPPCRLNRLGQCLQAAEIFLRLLRILLDGLRILLEIVRHLGHQGEAVSADQEAMDKIAQQEYDLSSLR